ncbi:hypothetical protein WR25_13712 [Diploscapter pachys]|uniref:WHIM2 domain-containing protein n=1 Tax=Diploscapter pachys TaxID=2018661 RepID=A0A2A2J5N8_9BILA|nr:hypothetical protein WR25_13712 [Diploscapter pachys]
MEIAEERSNIHSAKRIRPIGRDRHMRQYFWFNNDTNDDGIWIQDLGVTNGETYLRELYKQIRQSRKRKLDDKENTSQDARGEQNGKAGENDVVEIKRNNSISQHLNDMSVLSQRNRDESQSQDLSQTINFSQGLEDSMCDIDVIDNSLCQPEGPLSETWYHITDKETLVKLRDSLLERGERESELKNFLKKNFTEIAKSMEKFAKKVEAVNEAKEESEDEDEVQMVENED